VFDATTLQFIYVRICRFLKLCDLLSAKFFYVSILLGCLAGVLGDVCPEFRNKLVVSSFKVEMSLNPLDMRHHSPSDAAPLTQ